jgi:hypothetical protein
VRAGESAESRGRATCRRKALRGNVYFTAQEAERAARSLSRRCGEWVHAFRCAFCPGWHVGGIRTAAERTRRRQNLRRGR